ncbi:MAG TPA: AI-2E family transporter [Methylomirabilota bacterium]|nr:AI-2E family transporter [Methylomirabilota bacterium]
MPGALNPLLRFVGFVLVLASIYWAQAILIPVALAVLITFLLSPPVAALQRRRVPRAVAVVLVVVLALGLVAGIGTVLARQVMGLAEELPHYQGNIRDKMADVRLLGRATGLQRAQETVKRAANEVEREVERSVPAEARTPKPAPVIIQQDRSTRLLSLPATLSPWLDPLARAGLVAIMVPFMLLAREELRNRLLRLIGFGRLALTTHAMDEAAERVTRYLLTQSAVNTAFGTLVAVGLYVIGVPYALLFGFLAGVLRFLPYVGIWLGVGLPAAVALAVFQGWTRALLVVGLFAALELFTSGVLEVLLYARSAGVSEVGLLIAVAFWTWAWGPLGLLLATPLTVCLVVLAKYVPELEFLWALMGDEPVLSTDLAVYQRLLAQDEDEAARLLERHLAAEPAETVYDAVLLPSLVLAANDHARRRIGADEERFVVRAVRDIVEDRLPPREADGLEPRARVLAGPARSEADEVALLMLRNVLRPAGIEVEIVSPELLTAEVVRTARERQARVVVIAALPPNGLAQARYLCKRLRAGVDDLTVLVGRWCVREDVEEMREALASAGADGVATTLLETRDAILALTPLARRDRAA